MRLKAGPDSYLEYKYVLKANDYMLVDIQSQGLNKVLNAAKPLNLEWDLKAYSNEKSLTTENRYSEMYYEYEDGKSDYLGQSTDKTEIVEKVSYIAYKQHFF
jgi:YidC/Oxa1 family membrane protein insertase